ncbi:MAG: hypothetical protein ACI3Y5_05160 [Prevotella sp.]
MRRLIIALAVALATPAIAQAQTDSKVLFYETFDGLNGQGGNDGYFDNDEAAGVEVGAEDLLSADALDNKEGWGDFVKVAICNKCVRIATKKNNGEITTPTFAVNGTASLTFNAAAQLGDAVTLYVEIVGEGKLTYGGQTAQKIAIKLPESVAGETKLSEQAYTVIISEAAGDVRLKFSTVSTSASKQRAYLDEIKVAENTSAAISGIKADKTNPTAYDIQGRKANVNGRGIVIVNGKKMVR